jgi:hypothetical protein
MTRGQSPETRTKLSTKLSKQNFSKLTGQPAYRFPLIVILINSLLWWKVKHPKYSCFDSFQSIFSGMLLLLFISA